MIKLLANRTWQLSFIKYMSSSRPQNLFRPTKLQKTMLVWTKQYKSKDEIPELLSSEAIDKARNKSRIKLANILMILTALGSLGAILAGKAAAKRGESVTQQNLDWHKQYAEDYNKKNKTVE